jgi:hypothetical protein
MSNYPAGFDEYWERLHPDDPASPPIPGRQDFDEEPESDPYEGPEPDPFPMEEP